jgi:uncharacterized protein YegP (UPF0339 family)
MKLELFKGKGLQPWYLRLRGANGAVLATSEGYFSKWNAKRAAKKNFPIVPLVDMTE